MPYFSKTYIGTHINTHANTGGKWEWLHKLNTYHENNSPRLPVSRKKLKLQNLTPPLLNYYQPSKWTQSRKLSLTVLT